MFDLKTPAIVVNLGRFPLHHGMLGVIRSLGAVGVPVYAALEDTCAPAGWSRYLAGKFIWDPNVNAEDELLDGLAAIGERIGRQAVIIPTSDRAAIFIDEHAASLAKWFLFPKQKPGLTRALANKRELYKICQTGVLTCPPSFFPISAEEARRSARNLRFPVMVKITEPWRPPRPAGLASTAIVGNCEEMMRLFRIAETAPHLQLMIQERVPSAPNTDAMFAAYSDSGSRCLVAWTGEKLRSYPADAGMTAASRTTDNRELCRLLEEFLAQLGYHGIVDLELRLDSRDGRYKILDFNPRVGAQFRLYQNTASIDVVRAMHLDLTGRTVPQIHEFRPRSFVVENYELRLMMNRRPHRPNLREWLRSLPGEREFAWFSRHDFVPFILMWLHVVYNMLRDQRKPAVASGTTGPKYRSGRAALPVRARILPRKTINARL